MEYKSPIFDPRNDDPISKIAEDAVDALVNMSSSIRGWFKSKQKTESAEVSRSSSYALPEYEYLSYSERTLITPSVESFISDLRSLMLDSYEVSFESIYSRIHQNIPETLIKDYSNAMDSYWSQRSRLFGGDETYEEILKRYMEFASDVNSIPWFIESLVSGGGKIFDVIVKLLNKFSSKAHNTLDWEIFPIKPVVLALLWALLLMELTSKYTHSCASFEKERIAKIAISLVLALFAGFTGYVHSGGYTGVPPITSYMRTYYNAQIWFKNEYPYYYSSVPSFLKFNECDDFNKLTRSMQISAARGVNMVYTFRVGDSLLENLSGESVISEGVAKQTLKSVWPLPMRNEARKVYRLYKETKIYYL